MDKYKVIAVLESQFDQIQKFCIENAIVLDEEPSYDVLSSALNEAEDREWESSTDWDSSSNC